MRCRLLAVALAGLLLAACADDPVDDASVSPSVAAATPAALQFAAPMVGGGSIDFTQYAGRTVALWFWAPT